MVSEREPLSQRSNEELREAIQARLAKNEKRGEEATAESNT